MRAVEELERGGFVGDEAFAREIEDALKGRKVTDEIPMRYRSAREVPLGQIRRAVAREWVVTEASLGRRRGGADKMAAIYLARKLTRLGGREIGSEFGVKPARVSNIVTAIDQQAPSALGRRVERLRKVLGSRS